MKHIKIALIFFILTLIIYALFSPLHNANDYFLPLAKSILQGRIDVSPKPNLNELVPVNSKYFVVYPPMPAVVLIPFVLVAANLVNQTTASIILGALAVSLFYLLAQNFTKKTWTAVLATILFGFGTNFFYTALIGSSWYFAHITAILFLILALLSAIKGKSPVLQGLLFSFAFMSRLPVFLAFPIFLYLLVKNSEKRGLPKKLIEFNIPIILTIVIFGFYNLGRFGSPLQSGYSLIPGVLSEPWFKYGIFSIKYVPSQLSAIFLSMPKFTLHFPYFNPSNIAMALWLTTPALLLLAFVKLKDKMSLVFLFTATLVSIPSLIHGTVGFTQFGYRFSLDFIVFLLLALIPVFERIGWKMTSLFIFLSVLINFWAVWLFHLGLFHT